MIIWFGQVHLTSYKSPAGNEEKETERSVLAPSPSHYTLFEKKN